MGPRVVGRGRVRLDFQTRGSGSPVLRGGVQGAMVVAAAVMWCAWCMAMAVGAGESDATVTVCATRGGSGEVTLSPCRGDGDGGHVVAVATFSAGSEAAVSTTGGWPVLRVATTPVAGVDNVALARAAGMAEGAVTAPYVRELHRRITLMRKPRVRTQVRAFIERQYAWMRQQAVDAWSSSTGTGAPPSDYGAYVRMMLAQVEGLYDGYIAAEAGGGPTARGDGDGAHPLTLLDLLELNYDGDAFDIAQAAEAGVVDFVAAQGAGLPRFQQRDGGGSGDGDHKLRQRRLEGEASGDVGGRQGVLSPDSVRWADGGGGGGGGADATGSRLPRSLPDPHDLAAWVKVAARGRCTAAVVAAIIPAASPSTSQPLAEDAGVPKLQVWAAHTTWSDYLELVRVWKVYTLRFHAAGVASMAAAHGKGEPTPASTTTGGGSGVVVYRVSFSSYPGMVTSSDDWYVLGSGLLVTETTTAAVTDAALAGLSPTGGLPAWVRAGVANMVASTAPQWAATFAVHNGGTYGCSWVVLDAGAVDQARRSAGAAITLAHLPAASVMVVEQSPQRVWIGDITPVLRAQGVWISANRPFSPQIRGDLGYPDTPVGGPPPHPTPSDQGGGVEEHAAAITFTMTVTEGGRGSVVAPVDHHHPPAIGPSLHRGSLPIPNYYRFRSVPAGEVAAPPRTRWVYGSGVTFRARARGGEQAVLSPPHDAAAMARFRQQQQRGDAHGHAFTASGPSTASTVALPAAYFSHDDNPRSRILSRLTARVASAADMRRLIRHNDYEHDADSEGRPYLAVAARFDLARLDDTARAANGAVDGKVASIDDVLALSSDAVLGPTHEGGLPPFDWQAWVATGFCGGRAASGGGMVADPCPAHGDAIPVATLCTAGHGAGSLHLPCVWQYDWGRITP